MVLYWPRPSESRSSRTRATRCPGIAKVVRSGSSTITNFEEWIEHDQKPHKITWITSRPSALREAFVQDVKPKPARRCEVRQEWHLRKVADCQVRNPLKTRQAKSSPTRSCTWLGAPRTAPMLLLVPPSSSHKPSQPPSNRCERFQERELRPVRRAAHENEIL